MRHDRVGDHPYGPAAVLREPHGLGRVPSRLCVRHLRGDPLSAALITLTAVVVTIAVPALLVRLTGGTTVLYSHRPTRPEGGQTHDPQKQTDRP